MKRPKFDALRKKGIDVYCGLRRCAATDDGSPSNNISSDDHDGTMIDEWAGESLRSEELNFDYDVWRSVFEGVTPHENNQR